LSAVRRLTAFLYRETRSEPFEDQNLPKCASEKDLNTNQPLALVSASFRVGSNISDASMIELGTTSGTSFTVSGFDFSVKKGEVLAVCGPVGSGKTCLINGVIDEIPSASQETEVVTSGSVAYVSQTPFILNTTLRENILFGRPFRQDVYDRVLDACCLNPDLDQLGGARDLTEIGERGVTLSGGT